MVSRWNALRKSCPLVAGWVVKIGPNKKDEAEARANGKRHAPPHEIDMSSGSHELEHKIAYILSHAGIRQAVGDDLEPIGNRLPLLVHHGLNHYSRMSRLVLKKGVPLLSQGYEETFIEEGGKEVPVYWANYLYECVARDSDLYLAHVERVNSAHVYVFHFDKEGARADLSRLVSEFRADSVKMEHPERLLSEIYRFIRDDRRFIFDFVPKEGAELRYPLSLYLPGGEKRLWDTILSGDGHGSDLSVQSRQYAEASEEADRREAEFYRSKGSEVPPDLVTPHGYDISAHAGQGPAIGGASPSGNVIDDTEDLEDYVLRFGGGY